nr:hypothetical protein [uncultured Ruminococcus sp.]
MENEKTQNRPQSKGKKVFMKILNTLINIMIVIVLIVSLIIAAMALTSRANGISSFFGNTVQPIQSDSMKGGSSEYPSGDFAKGDLMIAKEVNEFGVEYDLGDIVTFETKDESGNKMLIVHRIVDKITDANGTVRYQTKGDNVMFASVPDQSAPEYYISAMDIRSVYYTKGYEGKIIKGVGSVLDFLQSQKGFFLVVLLPMIIFFMYELIRVVMNAMNYKKAKADEEKEEAVKAAVAAALSEQQASDNKGSDLSKMLTPEQLEQLKQYMESQKQDPETMDSDNNEKIESSENPDNSEE